MKQENKHIELATILLTGVVAFLIVIFLVVTLGLLAGRTANPFFASDMFYAIQGIVLLTLSVYLLTSHNLLKFSEIDFNRAVNCELKTSLRYFLYYLTAVIGLVLILYGISCFISTFELFPGLTKHIQSKSAVSLSFDISILNSPFRLGLYMISICVLVPISEELFFRNILYSALRIKLKIRPAIVISSAIFAVGHFRNPIFAFIMGAYFAYVFEKHRSLIVNVVLHSLVNILFVLSEIFI